MKKELFTIYESLKSKQENIYEILKTQGKKTFIDDIKRERLTFQDFIMSESHFISNMDIFLLSHFYKIPIIILSGRSLHEKTKLNDDKKNISNKFIAFNRENIGGYYIIQTIPIKKDTIPVFSLICEHPIKFFNILTSIPDDVQDLIQDEKLDYSIDEYIDNYDTRRRKKKLIHKILEVVS